MRNGRGRWRPYGFAAALAGALALAAPLAGCDQLRPAANPPNAATERTAASPAPHEADAVEPDHSAGAGVIYLNGTEPMGPLLPADTNEVGGSNVLDLLFEPLIYYDAAGDPYYAVAEEIATDDNQTWRITLRRGTQFSDGTPVTAQSFARAWDHAALLSTDAANAVLFSDIVGFYGRTEVGGELYADPTDPDFSLIEADGIVVEDDAHLTINLIRPVADFAVRLGHPAFAPLPDAAFDDPAAFGEHPIGNGPYELAEWSHDRDVTLVPSPTYVGPRQPRNAGVQFVFYHSLEAAYRDLLGGSLDILTTIPDSELAHAERDLDGRVINQPAAVAEGIVVPRYLDHFDQTAEGIWRRQAISMAIDRAQIAADVFGSTRTPARDFTAPIIPGAPGGPEGPGPLDGADVLDFHPDQAREAWAAAEAIRPFEGTFQLAYNEDGGHRHWIDEVLGSIHDTLGVPVEAVPVPDFATFRQYVHDGEMQMAFRHGWRGTYPSLTYFLANQYRTGAGSNDSGYSNPAFDALLDAAAAAPTRAAANDIYAGAQELLLADLPSIPLWNSNTVAGWAHTVANVQFTWKGTPVLWEVEKE